MDPLQVRVFEDRRWVRRAQAITWRHLCALDLVCEEPVLDVGGGDGLFLSLLAERKNFQRSMLFDVSPMAVARAEERGVRSAVVDITKPFPCASRAFATACALDVLEHLYDPLPVVLEMARVARRIVLVVPNFHYWKDRWRMAFGAVPFQCKPQRGHVHWFNYGRLRELIADAGLEVDAAACGGAARLGSIGRGLARAHPNLFAHSLAVRLRGRT